MKQKIIFIIFITSILSSLLFALSCYEDRESLVRLDLGSVPVGIIKIHVAVYDSTIAPENTLLTASFDPGTTAELSVPTGNTRIFVVVGEDSSGLATYSGVTSPINLNSANESITADMNDLSTLLTVADPEADGYYYFVDEALIGADTYLIYDSIKPPPWSIFYVGNTTLSHSYTFPPSMEYKFQPYFSAFDLYSDFERIML